MRHYDTSCGPMSYVPTRKNVIPEFVIKPYILLCSGVAIPFVKLQVWSFPNGIATPLHEFDDEFLYVFQAVRTSCRKCSKCFYVYLNIRQIQYSMQI